MVDTKVIKRKLLSKGAAAINVLGVDYLHCTTSDGGDIYLTDFGIPWHKHLKLENWFDRAWFKKNRNRLQGTSFVYKVPTKIVDNEELRLVVKNSRVGEDVPLETHTLEQFINTEFNSPWEEFALTMEMRKGDYGPDDFKIKTQEPLAIYVPPHRYQTWQTGRSKSKINRISARHPGLDLDILRQYKLIYRWIDGFDIVELLEKMGCNDDELNHLLEPFTSQAIDDMALKGYVVADMKPVHIIITDETIKKHQILDRSSTEVKNGRALLFDKIPNPFNKEGQQQNRKTQSSHDWGLIQNDGLMGRDEKEDSSPLKKTDYHSFALPQEKALLTLKSLIKEKEYSIIDYELLIRTPAYESYVKYFRRHIYLDHQRDRFINKPVPDHLKQVSIMDVPYIHGHAESTNGLLWVVGRDPNLFDYFLPERWRKTPSEKLSIDNEVFYTFTKDNIHLVWKTSRVGELPEKFDSSESEQIIRERGINSPFEEFAIAHYLNSHGVPTVYIRAIYMTGSENMTKIIDNRRFKSHKTFKAIDKKPILRKNRNYITIRGYFNGPDSWVASHDDRALYHPKSLYRAVLDGVLNADEGEKLFLRTIDKIKNLGYDASLLRYNDILIAIHEKNGILTDHEGAPEMHVCDFELIYQI